MEQSVVAIAHRLNTIIDFDQILVMGGGELVEQVKLKNKLLENGSRTRPRGNLGQGCETVGF